MNIIIWFGGKWHNIRYNSVKQKLTNRSHGKCATFKETWNKPFIFCMHYWIFYFMLLKFFVMICISKKSRLDFFWINFQLYKGRINATSHVIQHPMYGAGHKFRTLHLPVSTTLSEVLDRVSGKSNSRIKFSLTLC